MPSLAHGRGITVSSKNHIISTRVTKNIEKSLLKHKRIALWLFCCFRYTYIAGHVQVQLFRVTKTANYLQQLRKSPRLHVY